MPWRTRPYWARSFILKAFLISTSGLLLLAGVAAAQAQSEEQLKKLDQFGEAYLSRHPEAEDVRYMKALAQLKLGRRAQGRQELERLAAESGSSDIRQKAAAALKKDVSP